MKTVYSDKISSGHGENVQLLSNRCLVKKKKKE